MISPMLSLPPCLGEVTGSAWAVAYRRASPLFLIARRGFVAEQPRLTRQINQGCTGFRCHRACLNTLRSRYFVHAPTAMNEIALTLKSSSYTSAAPTSFSAAAKRLATLLVAFIFGKLRRLLKSWLSCNPRAASTHARAAQSNRPPNQPRRARHFHRGVIASRLFSWRFFLEMEVPKPNLQVNRAALVTSLS